MLSFSTEFPVREADCDKFIAAICKWIEGSPHTSIDRAALSHLPTDGRGHIDVGREQLEALVSRNPRETIAAFKHRLLDGDLEWTTSVVYSSIEDDAWVAVRTERDSAQPQLGLPPAKKPFVVKTLLSTLGGGLDGELYVADTPRQLASNDVGMTARLLNADADNSLPVVYVSRRFDGGLDVDPFPLARVLGGMAHVLVEPDRTFSRQLQGYVGSSNVYGGRVGVYWPVRSRDTYFLNEETPTDFDVRRSLVARLRAALLHKRPLSRLTWARAEAAVARTVFEQLRASGSRDVDEYVRLFDAELADKNKQLEDAEAEILRLRTQVRLDEGTSRKLDLTSIVSGEQEFFSGEFTDIINDAVHQGLAAAYQGSRRQHVLASTVLGIVTSNGIRTRRDQLKELLRDYRSMNKNTRDGLVKLGFSITEEGKHYKLVYMDDDRYTFVLPKSGSDHRGGLNAASDIGKRVY